MITMLLGAGANIQAHDEIGMTALMYAAWKNPNPVATTTLLKAGADAKATDNRGYAAIDFANENEKLKDTNAYRQLLDASK
jgi:ankyrin repeat protein